MSREMRVSEWLVFFVKHKHHRLPRYTWLWQCIDAETNVWIETYNEKCDRVRDHAKRREYIELFQNIGTEVMTMSASDTTTDSPDRVRHTVTIELADWISIQEIVLGRLANRHQWGRHAELHWEQGMSNFKKKLLFVHGFPVKVPLSPETLCYWGTIIIETWTAGRGVLSDLPDRLGFTCDRNDASARANDDSHTDVVGPNWGE